MKQFSVQMMDNSVSSQWWKKIMEHFVRVGDTFEIRCWREEVAEIEQASLYGTTIDSKYEVSIKGVMTNDLLKKLLTEEPTDKSIYNKMTKYFTLHVKNDLCDIWSEHYGTEMVIDIIADTDIEFFEEVMGQYPESFSVGTANEPA
ncbi:MAG TPA: hypothetical protein IAC96_14195 [Candidatus Fimimorpha faecalis]|uniref:Uncharacterized protein n=1 Tax=Candidatus Fimimorpha faecalis TaxID=2840824 RepID=A0A9D1JF14_9FIRM|nr:hypothetical protein [Candidatus Fimimorpha faecalis]